MSSIRKWCQLCQHCRNRLAKSSASTAIPPATELTICAHASGKSQRVFSRLCLRGHLCCRAESLIRSCCQDSPKLNCLKTSSESAQFHTTSGFFQRIDRDWNESPLKCNSKCNQITEPIRQEDCSRFGDDVDEHTSIRMCRDFSDRCKTIRDLLNLCINLIFERTTVRNDRCTQRIGNSKLRIGCNCADGFYRINSNDNICFAIWNLSRET